MSSDAIIRVNSNGSRSSFNDGTSANLEIDWHALLTTKSKSKKSKKNLY